ncbi:hypothetical protein [Oleiagrimonas sp. MCCC 1A03011]|uniref:hypothetical protein n=1 Tax=Oleiagrimonas sp. MCCC 1A03011 TaxID=1926883 RepID=UPI0011BE871A|nr:hypothetical protein [Oleiagrimonas sp. MCCC 1A03011]
MFVFLLFGLLVAVLFALGAYTGVSGRMLGKPWRFVAAGVFVAFFGSVAIGALDVVVEIAFPYLNDGKKGVRDNF